jgi:acetylornithine deacetylase
MNVQTTLAQLVSINSVSSNSNAEIISYLEARCERAGLTTKRFPHLDEKGIEKINLVGQTADAGFPVTNSPTEVCATFELALVGHTDTVPYDQSWTDALRLQERDGKLLARGACDTKAFIAAALTALEEIDLSKLKRPLALVFTADEEIGCLGAKRLAQAKPFTARYAIVGEPTSLQPMRSGKGYCTAEITVRGREAHSAYPQLGASAIFRAAHLIERIERIAEDLRRDQRAGFDPPYTTINVGVIRGGTAKNIIPGECRFTLEWRSIPRQPATHILELIESAARELQRDDADFVCKIDANRADDSFETSAGSPLVQFLERATSRASGTVAFGTEAPSMISLDAETVVFGPGDIRVAHRSGEFVPVSELEQCVGILREAIQRFCG